MAKKKKQDIAKRIENRRARHDFELGEDLVVGIELTGAEAKNLRMGHGHLRGSYVTIKDGQLWLINATISGTGSMPISEQDQTRSRRLLAKRREIEALIAAKQQGKTIVPLEVLTRGRFVKLRIAVARGKKKYDKRQALKERDAQREANRAMKLR